MKLHYNGEVQIVKLSLGAFDNNCYVVICPETQESLIIDTPTDAQRILDAVANTRVKGIIITHSHFDHLQALGEVMQGTGAPLAAHRLDAAQLPVAPTIFLRGGEVIEAGTVSLQVLHTPGHTPGSICLLSGRHLFSGDTLFPGGPGATQSAEAFDTILQSLTEKVFMLPEDTAIYPGHGADGLLGTERRDFNTFLAQNRKQGMFGQVAWLPAS